MAGGESKDFFLLAIGSCCKQQGKKETHNNMQDISDFIRGVLGLEQLYSICKPTILNTLQTVDNKSVL